MRYLIFPLLIIFFLPVSTSVLALEQDELQSVYIQTLDGRIYLFDPSSDDLVIIHDFDLRPGEGEVSISGDGQRFAYAIQENDIWTIGVGRTGNWDRFPTVTHDDDRIKGVVFTWFPPETNVVVSYIGRNEIGNTILIGRDLITYPSDEHINSGDFPYECQELVIVSTNQFGIQCTPIDLVLSSITNPASYIVFNIEISAVYEQTTASDVLLNLNTILQRNWVWLPDIGMLLFNSGRNDQGRGFYFIPDEEKIVGSIASDVVMTPRDFDLAPDGSRFIYEDASSNVWYVYNLQQQNLNTAVPMELEYTLSPEHLRPNVGVQWYTSDQILYATRDEGDREASESTFVIQSLSGEQKPYKVPGLIFSIHILSEEGSQ